jgi:PPOX class probable F420-dependent enzyme
LRAGALGSSGSTIEPGVVAVRLAELMTRERFVAFVRAVRLGVVATVDPDGNPEAALVGLAVTDAGDLIFDSPSDARKMRNLRHAPRVAVVIGADDAVSVQVEGDAEILAGADRAACGATYLAQFPGSRALDDGFSLVRIRPDWLRCYDARVEPARVAEGACW